jgi:uncharacterized membrane protein YraQ (UPF0718 family)
MLEFFKLLINNTWNLVAEMAPYLIFGFLVSGLLFWIIRPEAVERLLGKPGLSAVIKACLVGVPMPLCSCSVIPIAASLRKSGASRGATAAFISSTPQTGVDSIFATYSLLGGLFTAVRVVVAFISGIVTGLLIELFCSHKNQSSESSTDKDQESDCCASRPKRPGLVQSLHYGFVKLPSELAVALIVGLVLAGLVTTLLPSNLFQGSLSSGPVAFLIATLVGLPIYICATASIPMAYALIAAGLSPGAALVFLIVGPATNTATVATIWKIIGPRATGIYLISLLIISWASGWVFNASIRFQAIGSNLHGHESSPLSLWQHASGIVLIAVLVYGIFKQKSQSVQSTCCSNK